MPWKRAYRSARDEENDWNETPGRKVAGPAWRSFFPEPKQEKPVSPKRRREIEEAVERAREAIHAAGARAKEKAHKEREEWEKNVLAPQVREFMQEFKTGEKKHGEKTGKPAFLKKSVHERHPLITPKKEETLPKPPAEKLPEKTRPAHAPFIVPRPALPISQPSKATHSPASAPQKRPVLPTKIIPAQPKQHQQKIVASPPRPKEIPTPVIHLSEKEKEEMVRFHRRFTNDLHHRVGALQTKKEAREKWRQLKKDNLFSRHGMQLNDVGLHGMLSNLGLNQNEKMFFFQYLERIRGLSIEKRKEPLAKLDNILSQKNWIKHHSKNEPFHVQRVQNVIRLLQQDLEELLK